MTSQLLEVAAGRIVPPAYCIAAMTSRDGRWTFDGWDITETAIVDKDVVVTGTWHYTPRRHYTEPAQPTSKVESPTTADTGIALYTISSVSSVVALGGVSFLNRKRKGKND